MPISPIAKTSYPRGVDVVAGIKVQTGSWNEDASTTGILVATDDALIIHGAAGIPVLDYTAAENAASSPSSIRRPGVLASQRIAGPITCELGYGLTSVSRLIAGICGLDTVTNNADTSYEHDLTWESHVGATFTFAWNDGSVVHEWPYCKVGSLALNWNGSAIPTATIGLVGREELIDDSGTNKIATCTAALVTIPSSYLNRTLAQPRIWKNVPEFRMNARGGAGLAAGDLLHDLASLSLTFNRPWQEHQNNTFAPLISEPLGLSNFSGVAGVATFSFANKADSLNAYREVTKMRDASDVKIDCKFLGDTIAGANKFQYWLSIASAKLGSAGQPRINSTGTPTMAVPFTAEHPYATPTGHPAGTNPMRLRITNTLSTNLLA